MKKNIIILLIAALLLLPLAACTENTEPLFDPTSSPSAGTTATPSASSPFMSVPTYSYGTQRPSNERIITPTPSPTAKPTFKPTPTPAPPRFSLAEDADIKWDGATRYHGTLTRYASALNKEEMIGKLLGAAYKTTLGPSVETMLYESGQKHMALRQYAFTYTDNALLEERAPMALEGMTQEQYLEQIRQSLLPLFPAEMLAEGTIGDVSFIDGQACAVTARFIRRIDGLMVDDGAEGVQATMVASGMRDLSFQWSAMQESGPEILPMGLHLAIAHLNERQPVGDPVVITGAELAYTNGDNTFGVTYVLTWLLTDAQGVVYSVFN